MIAIMCDFQIYISSQNDHGFVTILEVTLSWPAKSCTTFGRLENAETRQELKINYFVCFTPIWETKTNSNMGKNA